MPPLAQRPPVPYAHQIALIPNTTIEFPTQRLWAASIFTLLQSIKIIDIFRVYTAAYLDQYNGILIKWFFIDAAFLWALYMVKIPWLQFSFLKTVLLIFTMFWVDFIAFAMPIFGISSVLFKGILGTSLEKRIVASKGQLSNVNNIVHNSSHILGTHTLHILPYGTAKLNPDDALFCLSSNEIGKKEIYIPIILNNTTPRSISISRLDFDTGLTTVREHTGKDIQRVTEVFQAKDGIEYYYIRIQKPGAYKINQIVSKQGVGIRLDNKVAFVYTCPHAHISPVRAKDYCAGDNEVIQFQVIGVPPLDVYYTKTIDDQKVYDLELNRIQPENFESPLLRRINDAKSTERPILAKPDSDFSWAAAKQLDVNLDLTFDKVSKQEYRLSKVRDGAGNVIDLSGLAARSLEVHRRPTVNFGCSQKEPANLLIGEKSVQLPLLLEGSGPFSVEYKSSGDANHVYSAKLKPNERSIAAHSPGEYSLVSVSDKFCQGEVKFPSSCLVTQPQLPAVKLQSTPIPSECAGDNEIGMKFVAEFTGKPPYALSYTVTRHNGKNKHVVDHKQEITDRSRHIFSYMPSNSGEYTYEFTTLDDRHYKKRPPQIAPIKQIVHPQPDARFRSTHRSVRTCLNEALSVHVDLRGTPPFRLKWTVGGQKYGDYVESESYVIKLPPFDVAGQHIVSLVNITDDNGCTKELEARDYTIDVRRDRPTASFLTENQAVRTVLVTEGASARLPIGLTGEGPWTVSYYNVELGERSLVTRRFDNANAEIEVKHVGHYALLSVDDAICKGDVLEPQYLVKWLEKPTLSIPEDQALDLSRNLYERGAVCQHASDSLDIEFNGSGPFYCLYKEYRSSIGGIRSHYLGSEEITAGSKRVHLPLKTREPGKYRYVFEKIADQRYTEPFHIDKLEVHQIVHAIPTIKFAKSRKDRTLCVGEKLNSTDMDPIYLEFTGVAPFKAEIHLRLESEKYGSVYSIESKTTRYKLDLDNELKVAGTYIISLKSVDDANGCGSEITDSETIYIKALEIATITSIDTCDNVCVGDNIDFSLFGVGPFTVQYQFNGRNEIAKTRTPKLSLLADKPGNITVVSVGDQRNKCKSYPKHLTKQIHEIPSSYVSGGQNVIVNVEEGEMVDVTIDLIGTAPFDFEWRRYKLERDSRNNKYYKGVVLESHNVYGVKENKYLIHTSTEGIIELASIKDRYCQYPI
ncbi:hypothetical protein [Parasitella parasitica]|uniref:Nucleoporin Pom152 n=1 Tax=Parasitella parasitica TaxID=35722 RepID=A0A0B7NCR6_9FUNG|nr:hypothetical protein [Parasitella parasitica]